MAIPNCKKQSSGGSSPLVFPWLIGLGDSPSSETIESRFTDSGHDFDYWFNKITELGNYGDPKFSGAYMQSYGRGMIGWCQVFYPLTYLGQLQDWEYTAIQFSYIDPDNNQNVSVKIYKNSDGTYSKNFPSSSSGGVACFSGDTKIKTKESYKLIKDIEVGDKVLSQDDNGNISERKILKTINHIPETALVLSLEEDIKIKTTKSHPFMVRSFSKLVSAEELQVGNDLVDPINRKTYKILKTEIVENNEPVYEIVVEGNNNYCVSEANILVYNEPSVIR